MLVFLCWDGCTSRQTFSPLGTIILLVCFSSTVVTKFQSQPRRRRRREEKFAFSTEIVFYVDNGTRYAYGYWESLIETHWYPIDPCRFRWPWVTLKGRTRGVHFSGGSTYARSYRLTENHQIRRSISNTCGEGLVSRGSGTPLSQGQGSWLPRF